MKKIYLLMFAVIAFSADSFAQPTVLGTHLVNGSYTTYDLTSIGLFKQYRLQASTNAAISTRSWEFASGTAAAPSYTTTWRPNTSNNTLSSNLFIPTSFANGARYNTGGLGSSGLLPVITAGNYYTFNVNINSATDNEMELLATNYNPVTISSVSNTTPANAGNSALITCTTSAAPSSGEYVYVRYSTSITFTTSSISTFYFTGTTGKALIPCQAAGTVYYYVMSSNQTATQITTDAGTYGKVAYDMATLNVNNNGGPNYTYTQGAGTNMDGIFHVPSTCYATMSAFVTALNVGTVTAPVTCYAIGGSATETATAGGISITQTGTAANPIVFQKFGTGSYTIQASSALTVGALNDAIIKLIGADYITIDGLTLQENAANIITGGALPANVVTGNNMTEWGIALLYATTTNGSQNNTIQNNTISLDRTYTNTFGIYSSVRHTATAPTVPADIANVTGSNFGNKIYSNTISNVNYGIVFIGSGVPAQMDNGNDIGGALVATGNTLTNWGSAGTATSNYQNLTNSNYGIFVLHQINDNISYNTITGATHTTTNVYGAILRNYTLAQPTPGTITSTTISYNTITLTSSSASGGMTVIQNAGLSALSTATVNITNNTILNCAITGAGTANSFLGILNSSAPGILNMTNNIIKGNTSTATTGGFQGIQNTGAVVTTLNINNNQLGVAGSGAITYSVATNQNFNCIYNTNAAANATVNMNFNSVDGISIVTAGVINVLLNNATLPTTVNMNSNQLGTATGTLISFSGVQTNSFTAISSGAGSSTATSSIQNNSVTGIVHSATGTGNDFIIYSNAAVATLTLAGNTLTNLSLNTTGNAYFIYDNASKTSGQVHTFNNNSIVTGFSKTASGAGLYGFFSPASSVNGSSAVITNNNFSNMTVTGATQAYGIQETDGVGTASGPTVTITTNTISNMAGGSGTCYGIFADYVAALTCSSNTISNITGTSNLTGIYMGVSNGQGTIDCLSNAISSLVSSGAGGNVRGFFCNASLVPTLNVYSNTITSLSSTGASVQVEGILINTGLAVNVYDNLINTISGSGIPANQANGINVAAGTTVNIYRNKIHTISETGALSTTSPAVNGLLISGGTTVIAFNNFISNLNASNANLADAIRGINVISAIASSTINLYYNSIYLNASSGGTNFGTSGIYHTTSATATTAALNMIDNIIVNTSTPNGTGVTAAYRRSSATLTNYAATSDYNLFYAGTPGVNNLIYSDGTNSSQSIAAYQAVVGLSPRDANSISVLPNFTSSTNLHLTATNNCAIDGAGIPIATYTTDIDVATRDVTTPDIGADEFTATYTGTLAGTVGSGVCENKNVSTLGTTYATSSCGLIATVLPRVGSPVSGKINTCVTLYSTAGALPVFNAEPYLTRHFDIEPITNPTAATATITLYFTQAEFTNYNAKCGVWPLLPTGPGDASGISHLKITQYHGTANTTPSSAGNYTGAGGTGIYIDPVDANIVWNAANSYWSVTFNVTGFSGFYIHTAPKYALPISLNYINGIKQSGKHLITWKVTCNTTPSATLSLERSADARSFTEVYTINATALRCAQPFDYTDAQPIAGINYYRLKMVDADGKITYSNTIALLNASKGFELLNIAPNPVTKGTFKLNVTAAASSKMEAVISDMQGRVVSKQTITLIAGYNSIDMNVSNLATGTYNISGISADDKTRVIRFVKQ